MNICIVANTLTTGGAEAFILRLSQAIKNKGYSVSVFVLRGDLVNKKMVDSIAPSVKIIECNPLFFNIIQKIDGLFFKLQLNFSLLRWVQIKKMKKTIIDNKIQVVHSHLMTSDIVTSRVCDDLNIPWITTIHGDYFGYYKEKSNQAARIRDFDYQIAKIKDSVSRVICITDKQKKLLKNIFTQSATDHLIVKIYNGYESVNKKNSLSIPNDLKQIPHNAFVIGMVARGIKEKGWDTLISAFEQLNYRNGWLVLVGGGDYLNELKEKNHNPHIIFTGNVINPLDYIKLFDVGCLPSRYSSESLPTTVIEYLYMGKPVIASDRGEIAVMVDAHSKFPSGLLINSTSISEVTSEIKSLLAGFHSDSYLRNKLANNTSLSFEKFNMSVCIKEYINVYYEVIK